MKLKGNLDLGSNLLLNPVLDQVEQFPESPKVGQLIFKAQRVMVCLELDAGLPIWAPLTPPLNTYIHDQPVAQMTWTIDHNLNASAVIVQVVGADGKHVIPDDVEYLHNQTIITFSEQQAGRAVLMIGNQDGSPRADYAFEQEFTEASTTWTVNHMLGYEPLLRVFIGNQEVQPQSITHLDANTAEVTFSSARTGYVRAV